MRQEPLRLGIVGCGNISNLYFKSIKKFDNLRMLACADLELERAQAAASEHGIPKACETLELLADPDIELVVNLTVPQAHYPVSKAALEAGKHVYAEKPLCLTRDEGKELLALAEQKNLRLGNAPDTFLGGGIQTALKLLDDGAIGAPTAGIAVMASHGVEHWHPNPAFYYQRGGGPVFDMGPYYLTALVALLGPARRVHGAAKKTFDERVATSEAAAGKRLKVEIPTHVTGILEFADGTLVTLIFSFDVWKHTLPRIELYGTEGSMRVPDPNTFRGPVEVAKEREDWAEMPLTHSLTENQRGAGVSDIANALAANRAHRAGGDLAYHVLDIMHALHDAAEAHTTVELTSSCERPAPLPPGLPDWTLDA